MQILIEELGGGIWVAGLKKKGKASLLDGLEFDPPAEEVRWGSIYWAKVARIDKALDAAYVNLDGDNIGILHNVDVRIEGKDGKITKGGSKEIGKLLQPGQMIAVQAKSGFLSSEEFPYAKAGTKSPKVSMDVSLPGRYLILSPMETENRISRRVKQGKMRKDMQQMLESLSAFRGCILRAAGAHTQTDILVREAKILASMWDQIKGFFEGDSPQLIAEGPDAIQRMLSDHAGQTFTRIEVSTMDHFERAEEWCDIFAPDLITKINPVELDSGAEDFALFEHYGIVPQIEALIHPYWILDSGATIIIQDTAALTAVDVNSAVDNRSKLEINNDAAIEIARQMRLRNIGGAVIIDFLKMKDNKDKDRLKKTLEKAFENDPCTVQIHGWTGLGMMEISRMRRTPSFMERYESMMPQE